MFSSLFEDGGHDELDDHFDDSVNGELAVFQRLLDLLEVFGGTAADGCDGFAIVAQCTSKSWHGGHFLSFLLKNNYS